MMGVRFPGVAGGAWLAADQQRKALEGWLFGAKRATYGLSLLRILYGLLITGLLAVNFAQRQFIWGVASRWLQPLVAQKGFTWPFTLFSGNSPALFTATYLLMGLLALLFTLGWRTRLVTRCCSSYGSASPSKTRSAQMPETSSSGSSCCMSASLTCRRTGHWTPAAAPARRHGPAVPADHRARGMGEPVPQRSGYRRGLPGLHHLCLVGHVQDPGQYVAERNRYLLPHAHAFARRLPHAEQPDNRPPLHRVRGHVRYGIPATVLPFPAAHPPDPHACPRRDHRHAHRHRHLPRPAVLLPVDDRRRHDFLRDPTVARAESKAKLLLRGARAGRNTEKDTHREREFANEQACSPAPHQSLLIYDGDCGFCQRTLDVMKKRLATWPRTAPYQRLNLDQHGVSSQDAASAMLWVEPGKPPLAGAAAFARLFRDQPQLRWRTLGQIMTLPGTSHIAAIVYRTIARHRHQLPGGTSTCQRPAAEARQTQPDSYAHQTRTPPTSQPDQT